MRDKKHIVVLDNGHDYSDHCVLFVGFDSAEDATTFADYVDALQHETCMTVVMVGDVEWWSGNAETALRAADSIESCWMYDDDADTLRRMNMLRERMSESAIRRASAYSSIAWLATVVGDDASQIRPMINAWYRHRMEGVPLPLVNSPVATTA